MGLTTARVVSEQDFRDTSASQLVALGTYQETVDGRGYRYARAGAVDLDPGKLSVAATLDSNVVNVFVAATAAVAAEELVIDAGAAVVADAYKEGYVAVSDDTGEGATYQVRTHNVLGSAGELILKLHDVLKVGVTVDVSQVTLMKNPHADIVISAADQADLPVGVQNVTISATEFGWVQTKGMCAVWADEAIAAGLAVTTGSSVPGSVEALDAAGESQVGVTIEAAVDDEYRHINLSID